MKNKKDSSLSKKFIISIGLIYSLLIVSSAITFKLIININSRQLKDILIENNNYLLLKKSEIIIDKLKNNDFNDISKVSKFLKYECLKEPGFFYTIIIYKKTADENYFRIIKRIPLNENINPGIDINIYSVKEKKNINYFKKGLLNTIVEPKIYSRNNIYWQNIYSPLNIKNRKYVIQYMASAAKTSELLLNNNKSTKKIMWFMIILTVILIVAVTAITVIFIQNYSLLIKNLSVYIGKAAKGDLDVNIKKTDDRELNELANSFNSLIHELKDKSVNKPTGDLFKLGVKNLKENKLDDSIAIFKTLTIINPESFGSFFNLGVSYAKMKNYKKSLEMFSKSLELNRNHDFTHQYIEKVKRLIPSNG